MSESGKSAAGDGIAGAESRPERAGGKKRRSLIRRFGRFLASPASAVWRAVSDRKRTARERATLLIGGAAGMASFGFGAILFYIALLVPFTPSRDRLARAATARPSIIVDAAGAELARFETAYRKWIKLEDVSPHVIDALVAVEDHRFYEHRGIDYRRLASSAVYTVMGDRQGGSTISMQLARNLYPESIGNAFGPSRKCKEVVVASKLESVLTKEQIIELYLNTAPFLYNVRGIEVGARTYFGKPARELSLEESAVMIGMLKATSFYNPVRHPERARQRRNVVLHQMLKHGAIDSTEYRRASESRLVTRFRRPVRADARAPHFTDRVKHLASEWARQHGYDLRTDNLTIHTPLDPDFQHYAVTAVRRQGDALQRVANVEWSRSAGATRSTDIRDYAALDRRAAAFDYLWSSRPELVEQFIRESDAFRRMVATGTAEAEAIEQIRRDGNAMSAILESKSRLEVGFVAIDPRTGHVKAWVGSRDHVTAPFDHVAAARRQPGSTFKPIVYAAALEAGYNPDDLIPNRDVEIDDRHSGPWRIASVSDESRFVSLREGLSRSHNNVAVHLLQEVGTRRTVDLARRLGIAHSDLDAVPSLALGTSPVSLLEMASVYATIAAGGMHRPPQFVTKITDGSGETVASYVAEPTRVMSEESAIELSDMLRDAVDRGTGQRIRYQFGIRADVGGKTGTTQHNMDGWFMTIHPHLAAGSWVGFDDPRIRFRSDFWGQGAHNALFVVGDVLRQASATGVLSQSARFPDPPRSWRRYRDDDDGSWFGRQFRHIADFFRPDPTETIDEIVDRVREYEQLKERVRRHIEELEDSEWVDDRIIDAYRREWESDPELRAFERSINRQIERWLADSGDD